MKRYAFLAVLTLTVALILYGNRYKIMHRDGEMTRMHRLTSKMEILRDGKWRQIGDEFKDEKRPQVTVPADLTVEDIELIELNTFTMQHERYLNLEIYNGTGLRVISLAAEVTFETGDEGGDPVRRIYVAQGGPVPKSVGNCQILLGTVETRKVKSVKIVGGSAYPMPSPSVLSELTSNG